MVPHFLQKRVMFGEKQPFPQRVQARPHGRECKVITGSAIHGSAADGVFKALYQQGTTATCHSNTMYWEPMVSPVFSLLMVILICEKSWELQASYAGSKPAEVSGGDIPRGSQQLMSATEGKIKTATDVCDNYLAIHCGHPRSQ